MELSETLESAYFEHKNISSFLTFHHCIGLYLQITLFNLFTIKTSNHGLFNIR